MKEKRKRDRLAFDSADFDDGTGSDITPVHEESEEESSASEGEDDMSRNICLDSSSEGEGSDSDVSSDAEEVVAPLNSDDECAEHDLSTLVMEVDGYDAAFENLVDHRLLLYTKFYLNEGLSEGTIKRMEYLMSVLYGAPPPISHKDVTRYLSSKKADVIDKKLFYCNTCGTRKKEKKECCRTCHVPTRNLSDTVSLVVMKFQNQLKHLIEFNGKEIINAHRAIHCEQDVMECTDIRRYPGYQRLMETEEEFSNGVVHLICTISSDGARFKRLSKRECTPVVLRPEGFCLDTKKNGGTMILIAIAFADTGIKAVLTTEFVERCFDTFRDLSFNVIIEGRAYTFKMQVMTYLADMKEQHNLTGLPNWHQPMGCSHCFTVGSKKDRGKITYNNPATFQSRHDDGMRLDACIATNGYSKATSPALYRYFLPTVVSMDPFHTKAMGVCKRFLSEVIKPSTWTFAKLKAGYLESIETCISGIRQYTYDTVKLQSFKRISRCTGRELEKLSHFVAALVAWNECSISSEFNVFSLGLYHAFHFTGKLPVNPGTLRLLLDTLYEFHVSLSDTTITMKFHEFYKHLQTHEEQYGHLYTTEPFERLHRVLMTSLNHQTTNCEDMIGLRHSVSGTVTRELNAILPKLSSESRILVEKSLKLKSTKFIDLRKNPCNVMLFEDLSSNHQTVASQLRIHACQFLKRAYYTSHEGTFLTGCQNYWITRQTSISCVSFSDPRTGEIQFGRVQLLALQGDTIFAIVDQYRIEPMQETLKNYFTSSTLSSLAKKVLNICLEFPVTFGCVTSSSLTVVPFQHFVSPAVLLEYNGKQFCKAWR